MFPYLVIYLVPLICWIYSSWAGVRSKKMTWFLAWLIFTLFIGLRYEVGADWLSYLNYFDEIGREIAPSPDEIRLYLVTHDIGYVILNWVSSYFNLGIYGVNLGCAGIFMTGLVAFCRKQPLQWVAFSVAIPIFVIMIAMGTVRQATALGLFLLSVIALQEKRLGLFLSYIILAGFFHKSALFFTLLIFLFRNLKWVVGASVIAGISGLLLVDAASALWVVYVDNTMHSEGGFLRVLMSAVPVLFMLLFWKRWREFPDNDIWLWFGGGAILSLFLASNFSTAADRMAIYLAPFQIVGYSRLPLIINNGHFRASVVLLIIGVHGVMLFVWLNYAVNAGSWIPYKSHIANFF
jgi:hypothetical protein